MNDNLMASLSSQAQGYLCCRPVKLTSSVPLQELLITLSACKTASARKVTAVLPVSIPGECCTKFVAHSCLAFSLFETEWYLLSSYSISHLHLSDPQTSRIQRAARHCQRRRIVSTSRTLPTRECAVDKSLDCFCRHIRLCKLDYWLNFL